MAKNPNYLKGFFSGSMDGGSIHKVFSHYLCLFENFTSM